MKLEDQNKSVIYWVKAEQSKRLDIFSDYPSVVKCDICSEIDNSCNDFYSAIDSATKLEILNSISLFEINGYKLLQLEEQNGAAYMNLNLIRDINHYPYNNNDLVVLKEIDPQTDLSISLSKSRWCSYCGARKPDVVPETYILIKNIHKTMTISQLNNTELNNFEGGNNIVNLH